MRPPQVLLTEQRGQRLQEAYTGRGVIYGMLLPPDVVEQLTPWQRDPTDTLHLTLSFLGKVPEVAPAQILRMMDIARETAARWTVPLMGQINGLCRFIDCNKDDPDGRTDAVVLTISSPALAEFRQALRTRLQAEGLLPPEKHSWIPHITLGYYAPTEQPKISRFTPIDVRFMQVAMFVAGVVTPYGIGIASVLRGY